MKDFDTNGDDFGFISPFEKLRYVKAAVVGKTLKEPLMQKKLSGFMAMKPLDIEAHRNSILFT